MINGAASEDSVATLLAVADRIKSDQKQEAVAMAQKLEEKKEELLNMCDALKIVGGKAKSYLASV